MSGELDSSDLAGLPADLLLLNLSGNSFTSVNANAFTNLTN